MLPNFMPQGCGVQIPHQPLYNLLLSFYQTHVTKPTKILKKIHMYHPITNRLNASFLLSKNINYLNELEYVSVKEIKHSRFTKMLKKTKYAKKFITTLNSSDNFEIISKTLSKKIRALVVSNFNSLRDQEKRIFSYKIREFKYLKKIECRPFPERTGDQRERRMIRNSLSALRKLEFLNISCNKPSNLLSQSTPFMMNLLTKLRSISLNFQQIIPSQFFLLLKTLLKLKYLTNFEFFIPENQLSPLILEGIKIWLVQSPSIKTGQLTVLESIFMHDLSILNDLSYLEIRYVLAQNIQEIAANLMNIQTLTLPVSFDWRIIPTLTLDHISTQNILYWIGQMEKINTMSISYSFDIENSDLTGCYPAWAFIVTNYNFQMVTELNLSVLLSPEMIMQFFTIFNCSVISMVNMKDFSLTLHNDGSSNKKFYLEQNLVEALKSLQKLPTLKKFEFNSEIEIQINSLPDFYVELTSLQNLTSFKSEWLQISSKSLRTFMKKLAYMEKLELIDVHLYSLNQVRVDEVRDAFDDLKQSLPKMNRIRKMTISADNECFENESLWQETEILLRKMNKSKLIELNLAHTE